jgi:hypothetical protein
MKLSEAMRRGSMMGPQIAWKLFGPDDSSCAMGAAFKGVGISSKGTVFDLIGIGYQIFPILQVHPAPPVPLHPCPVDWCTAKTDTMWSIIVDLNNNHGWTREQIADWVETIERQHEPEQSAPAQASEQVTERVTEEVLEEVMV